MLYNIFSYFSLPLLFLASDSTTVYVFSCCVEGFVVLDVYLLGEGLIGKFKSDDDDYF